MPLVVIILDNFLYKSNMNNRQLTFAREYRGLNQSDLASNISGLSQSNLSKFEKGLGYLSEAIQKEIIEFLDFPEGFFDLKINNVVDNANYRKRSGVTKNAVQTFELRCKLIGYIIDQMSEDIDWPEFTFIPLNVDEGFSPEYIASYTRKKLGLEQFDSVKNIFTLIESKGIIIYEIDAIEKFDGVSFVTDKGYPVIIINKNFSNDRKRFTLAHELGHLLMHNENNYPIPSYRDKEQEANNFASEFLMPENAMKNSLRGLRFNDLGEFKSYWLTSMASIIRRAYTLGCINQKEYTYFNIQMSRYGYNKVEPIKVFIDCPTLFAKATKLFQVDLSYSDNELQGYLKLPMDILNDLLLGANENKLKVIR